MISTLDMYRCRVAGEVAASWTLRHGLCRPLAWLARYQQSCRARCDFDLERRHAQKLPVSLRELRRVGLDPNVLATTVQHRLIRAEIAPQEPPHESRGVPQIPRLGEPSLEHTVG